MPNSAEMQTGAHVALSAFGSPRTFPRELVSFAVLFASSRLAGECPRELMLKLAGQWE